MRKRGTFPWLPRAMPESSFNIAVAELVSLDANGQPVDNPDGRQLSSRIAGFLDDQKETIAAIMAADVVVWGPAQRVDQVREENAASRAQALNAYVLVYGVLRQDPP